MLVAQRHQQAEHQWRRQRSDDLMALLLEEGDDAPRLLGLSRHRLPALLWHYRDDEAVRELLDPLQRLRARDAGGQLLGTLRSWCEQRGHSQACADALGVPRNSLRYRLARIAELSGVDPLCLDGLLSLHLGLQLLPET